MNVHFSRVDDNFANLSLEKFYSLSLHSYQVGFLSRTGIRGMLGIWDISFLQLLIIFMTTDYENRAQSGEKHNLVQHLYNFLSLRHMYAHIISLYILLHEENLEWKLLRHGWLLVYEENIVVILPYSLSFSVMFPTL